MSEADDEPILRLNSKGGLEISLDVMDNGERQTVLVNFDGDVETSQGTERRPGGYIDIKLEDDGVHLVVINAHGDVLAEETFEYADVAPTGD